MKRIILALLIASYSTQPVTTGLSCLHNPATGKKVAILYDKHLIQLAKLVDLDEEATTAINNLLVKQANELQNLGRVLAQRDTESLFLSECSAFKLKLEYLSQQGILGVIPTMFVKSQSNKVGTLTFIAADPREALFFRALELCWRTAEFKHYLEENSLTNEYANLTIDLYVNHLKDVLQACLKKLDQLTLDPSTKTTLRTRLEKLNESIDSYRDFALTEYNLTKSDHLVYLYEQEHQLNRAHLINMSEEIGIIHFDLEFLSLIEKSSFKDIVIQAGGLHATWLAHQLQQVGYQLSHEYGYTDDYIIDAHSGAVFKTPITKLDVATVKEVQAKALDNVDQLITQFIDKKN